MRRAADAARARRHDQAGLRVLVAQDDLEAAEQLGLGPGVGHHAVLDIDTHIEIAFDPPDRRNVECLYWHCSDSCTFARQTTKMSCSAQAGAAFLAAPVSAM